MMASFSYLDMMDYDKKEIYAFLLRFYKAAVQRVSLFVFWAFFTSPLISPSTANFITYTKAAGDR